MEEKIIVITPDDTVELADYSDYRSIQGVVNGLFECFHSFDLPIDPMEINPQDRPATGKLNVALFCNEEFLFSDSEEFDKINAIASLWSGQEIRGNVAMLIDVGNGDDRGFGYKTYTNDQEGTLSIDYCECWAAEKSVREFKLLHERELTELHERCDGNKSEPVIEVMSWDNDGSNRTLQGDCPSDAGGGAQKAVTQVHKSGGHDERG